MHIDALVLIVGTLVLWSLLGLIKWPISLGSLEKATQNARTLKELRELRRIYITLIICCGPVYWIFWAAKLIDGPDEYFTDDIKRVSTLHAN